MDEEAFRRWRHELAAVLGVDRVDLEPDAPLFADGLDAILVADVERLVQGYRPDFAFRSDDHVATTTARDVAYYSGFSEWDAR